MDTAVIDERDLLKQFQRANQEQFLQFIKDYDDFIAPSMRARGYKLKNQSSRTVTFIFGEIEFSRNRWYKQGKCKIPVDEKLGLKKHERISKEMVYQVAHLSTFLPYRKVGDVLELVNQVIVSKDTVLKAVKKGHKLHKMKEDYEYYQDNYPSKTTVKDLYLEGDGVMVKTTDQSKDNHNIDLAHFVIHTGRKQVGPNRYELQNKKEFICSSNNKARDKVLDYLYYHYNFSSKTQLICNSDGGCGYGHTVFEEFGCSLGVRVEYFWDSYHLTEQLRQFFQPYPKELLDLSLKAVKNHNKKMLRTVFDTVESLIENEDEFSIMEAFRKKIYARWRYTKPAELRGLSHKGIGIMESQHRKVTYRMKKRGMYWSLAGAETMSRMIIAREEGTLRDLFMGDWQNQYQRKVLNKGSADAWVRLKGNPNAWLQANQLSSRGTKSLKSTLARDKARKSKKI